MQQLSEVVPERFVTCSKSIVLEYRCGEKLILLGGEGDWRKEGHAVFVCSGCGKNLTLTKQPLKALGNILTTGFTSPPRVL